MAFCNRVGSILKQSISQGSASSMMNTIRCMSSTKLFVGGLSFGTDDGSLKGAFSSFGEVVDGSNSQSFFLLTARVITDRETGRSRGFGFVNFTDTESASSAMSAMDGQELHGRSIRVSYATERTPSRQFGGGGGYRGDTGFGGGYQRNAGGYGGANEEF